MYRLLIILGYVYPIISLAIIEIGEWSCVYKVCFTG